MKRRLPPVSLTMKLWGAIGLMAALPLIWVWAIDELDLRRLNIEVQGAAAAVAQNSHPELTLAENTHSNRRVTGLPHPGDPGVPAPPPPVGHSYQSAARAFDASIARPAKQTTGMYAAFTAPLLNSLWSTPELQIAIVSSLIFLGMAIALAVNVLRSVNQFDSSAPRLALQHVAYGPGQVRVAVPDLTAARSAAERLTLDLHNMAEQVRLDSEDNVHAMRTPLATIMGSLNAIRRGLPARETRALRALQFVSTSSERLSAMIDASRAESRELVNFFVAPRQRIDLAEVLRGATDRVFVTASTVEAAFVCHHVEQVFVRAPTAVLEEAIEAVLLTARSATLSGSSIVASLVRNGEEARLKIDLSRNGEFAKGRDWSCLTLEPGNLRRQDPYGNARRTITLLGGHLDTRASEHGGWSILITLPLDKG